MHRRASIASKWNSEIEFIWIQHCNYTRSPFQRRSSQLKNCKFIAHNEHEQHLALLHSWFWWRESHFSKCGSNWFCRLKLEKKKKKCQTKMPMQIYDLQTRAASTTTTSTRTSSMSWLHVPYRNCCTAAFMKRTQKKKICIYVVYRKIHKP